MCKVVLDGQVAVLMKIVSDLLAVLQLVTGAWGVYNGKANLEANLEVPPIYAPPAIVAIS